MLRADLMICTNHRPLEKRKYAFNRVGVDFTAHPFIVTVAYRIVSRVVVAATLIRSIVIRKEVLSVIVRMSVDECVKRLAVGALVYLQANAATALDCAKYHRFILAETTALAAHFAAKIRFVSFNGAAQEAFVRILHGGANAVTKIPRRFVRDFQSALELVRGNALVGLAHEVHSGKPLLKGKVRIVKDRSCSDRELIPASVAIEHVALDDFGNAHASAFRANDTIGPAQFCEILAALVVGRELVYEVH